MAISERLRIKKFVMKSQTTYRSTDKRYIFWSSSQYHLQVIIATTQRRQGNYITLLWQTQQVAVTNAPSCHEKFTRLPWQQRQITIPTTPGNHDNLSDYRNNHAKLLRQPHLDTIIITPSY